MTATAGTKDRVEMEVGAWGLFCGPEGRQLVLVGDEPCGPVSARKVMKTVPRQLLLLEGRVTRVYEKGRALREFAEYGGKRYEVQLHPLITPLTQSTVAVYGIVMPAGETAPERPLVGSWEWEIKRGPDGLPTPERRTYWDENVHKLYDVDPEIVSAQDNTWEVGEWANEMIDPRDQMRLSSSIRGGIQDGLKGDVGVVRCLTCYARTGYPKPPSERGRRHLRLCGQIRPIAPEDPVIIMRGFSYEAPEDFHDLALRPDASRVDDALRRAMELSRDPMAILDVSTLEVMMTNPAWRQEDFGHVVTLEEHSAGDNAELRAFLLEAATDFEELRSRTTLLRRADGETREVVITAGGVRADVPGRDVVVRIEV